MTEKTSYKIEICGECGIRIWHTECTPVRIGISHTNIQRAIRMHQADEESHIPGKSMIRLRPPVGYPDTENGKPRKTRQVALAHRRPRSRLCVPNQIKGVIRASINEHGHQEFGKVRDVVKEAKEKSER